MVFARQFRVEPRFPGTLRIGARRLRNPPPHQEAVIFLLSQLDCFVPSRTGRRVPGLGPKLMARSQRLAPSPEHDQKGPGCHGIRKLLATVLGPPENAGTRALRKVDATHPPTEVPPNGPLTTCALVTRPLVEKVICTFPEPVGPPAPSPASEQ